MPASVLVSLAGFGVAVLLMATGLALARTSGSRVRQALRLGGARQLRVGDLPDLESLPQRPIRVIGRVRCGDPILTPEDDRLVALHRDVQVQLPGGAWRTIERLRESRSFELWDHDASLSLDPSQVQEPLVAIPHVWRGSPDELVDPSHRSAVKRLVAEGTPPVAARSVTRMVSVVERLLVLVQATRDGDGAVRLGPPPGGYVLTSLELPDAMRLLGGPRRGRLLAGIGLATAGVLVGIAVFAWRMLAG